MKQTKAGLKILTFSVWNKSIKVSMRNKNDLSKATWDADKSPAHALGNLEKSTTD
jgi:hypothetical protein